MKRKHKPVSQELIEASQYEADLRLIIKPHLNKKGVHHDKYDVYVGGNFLVTSQMPLRDGARRLKEIGFNPDTTITARREGESHDIWKVMTLREAAKMTGGEDDE